MDKDTIVRIRLGRLGTALMGAIKLGVENRENLVDEVAVMNARDMLQELIDRGAVKVLEPVDSQEVGR